MVRRHKKSGFMGGAFVFPGGKLDEADCTEAMLAQTRGRTEASAQRALGDAVGAEHALGLFVAAARETFEETGILLADVPVGTKFDALRHRRLAGEPFLDLLKEAKAFLRLDALIPWTRWITPEVEPRRFDARFFVASAPDGQPGVRDRIETIEELWISPSDALGKGHRGEIVLPPPTIKSLEVLASHANIDSAITTIRNATVPTLRPALLEDEDGAWVVVLPGDPSHSDPVAALPGSTRLVLRDGRWWAT